MYFDSWFRAPLPWPGFRRTQPPILLCVVGHALSPPGYCARWLGSRSSASGFISELGQDCGFSASAHRIRSWALWGRIPDSMSSVVLSTIRICYSPWLAQSPGAPSAFSGSRVPSGRFCQALPRSRLSAVGLMPSLFAVCPFWTWSLQSS